MWDENETHTKVIIGFFNLNQNNCVIQFYHGADGNYIDFGYEGNRTISKEPFVNRMKCTGKVCMSLGYTAMERIVDMDVQDQYCMRDKLFEYCDKYFISTKRMKDLDKKAFKEAKNLNSKD